MSYIKKYKVTFLFCLILSAKFISFDQTKEQEVKVNEIPLKIEVTKSKKPLKNIIKKNTSTFIQKSTIIADFAFVTKKCTQSLPEKKHALEMTNKEIHHTPESLLTFAQNIAELKDFLKMYSKQHPKLKDTAAKFYKNCSMNKELLDSARSLCLTHLLLINAKRRITVDLNLYPTKILALSKDILDLD